MLYRVVKLRTSPPLSFRAYLDYPNGSQRLLSAMASSQVVSDGALFLYRCITSSNCTINWEIVGAALHLKPGTASKRYSRLRQRIDKTNATLSSKWSGELDGDGEFLLECITSCKCPIDFNTVGRDGNLKPATASKRYNRLLAKYKQSAGPSADEAAAGPSAKFPSTPATGSQKKRKSTLKNESDSDHDTPIKKAKVETEVGGSAQGRRVKREESEAIEIPATDGASDLLSAERKTRGKKVQYQVDEISDSDGPAEEKKVDLDDDYDNQGETEDGVDNNMSDSDDEGDSDSKSKIVRRQVLHRLQTISTPTARRTSNNSPLGPANIPIGLTGLKVPQSGADIHQPAPAAHTASDPIDLVSVTSLEDAEQTEYETASEELDNEEDSSELRTPHGAQLDVELVMATPPEVTVSTEDVEVEDVVESIEDAEEPRPGFFARMLPWWK